MSFTCYLPLVSTAVDWGCKGRLTLMLMAKQAAAGGRGVS